MCDMACSHCFYTIGHEHRSTDRVKPELAKKFAACIKNNGFTSVILTGGDPLCSSFKHETYELVRELKTHGLRVLINTSAAKLDESDINNIIELGVDRIDISINSYIREVHNSERGYFDDAIWTIKGLIDRGYNSISTTTVITESNAPYAADTLKWLIALGVEDARYQPVYLIDDGQNYGPIEKALTECSKVYAKAHTKNYLDECHAAYYHERQNGLSICQMGKTYFICDSVGNISPCFHRMDVQFGNILTDPPQDIEANIAGSHFSKQSHVDCFGKHCISLYDNPIFWR